MILIEEQGADAATLGYKTHYFGTINGEYAPTDIAGKYQSLNRYVKEDATRVWGFPNSYGAETLEGTAYPVSGNCVFVCAIVMGKPAAEETIETWGTNHGRPNNWVIWDGVPNENPVKLAEVTAEADATSAATAAE